MVEELSPEELIRLLDNDETDVTVIDVREPVEYQLGHVPGSENVPMGELSERLPDCDLSADVIALVCPVGELSVQAARLVSAYEGVDRETEVVSLAGGYDGWSGDLETG